MPTLQDINIDGLLYEHVDELINQCQSLDALITYISRSQPLPFVQALKANIQDNADFEIAENADNITTMIYEKQKKTMKNRRLKISSCPLIMQSEKVR